ncbi:MAG: hypothetical protein Q8Q01_01555 [archaeon]|nr:hypothetical protein [archaeon]
MNHLSVVEVVSNKIISLTGHSHLKITTRGNTAIAAALSIFAESSTILIPEEGGWLSYRTLPKKQGLQEIEVKCNDAVIDLIDLEDKLIKLKPSAFLYENPGGYFAEQNSKRIFELCEKNDCLVIMDVSGCIGTSLCDGNYADIMVGSFGEWKLVEAHVGGFISCKDDKIFNKLNVEELVDESSLNIIEKKLTELPERINSLLTIRKKVIDDLSSLEILHPTDLGFVVVVAFSTDAEKEKLISYCKVNDLEWTECPRYIRVNRKAISIEIKRIV